ncbi:hypothetical protein Dimus_000886 [Dionaea muscipula]
MAVGELHIWNAPTRQRHGFHDSWVQLLVGYRRASSCGSIDEGMCFHASISRHVEDFICMHWVSRWLNTARQLLGPNVDIFMLWLHIEADVLHGEVFFIVHLLFMYALRWLHYGCGRGRLFVACVQLLNHQPIAGPCADLRRGDELKKTVAVVEDEYGSSIDDGAAAADFDDEEDDGLLLYSFGMD